MSYVSIYFTSDPITSSGALILQAPTQRVPHMHSPSSDNTHNIQVPTADNSHGLTQFASSNTEPRLPDTQDSLVTCRVVADTSESICACTNGWKKPNKLFFSHCN